MFRKILASTTLALFAASLAACSGGGSSASLPALETSSTIQSPAIVAPAPFTATSVSSANPGASSNTSPQSKTVIGKPGVHSMDDCGYPGQADVCVNNDPPFWTNGGGGGGGGGGGCPPATQGHRGMVAACLPTLTFPAGGGGGLANLGRAKQVEQCSDGSGATSIPIGLPVGVQDSGAGPNGNEVNNVFLINISTGSGGGAIAGYAGFFVTTFNKQTWLQVPVNLPIYNGPIFINLGNMTVSNNATFGTQTFENNVSNLLNKPTNSGISGAIKSAIAAYLQGMAKQGTSASTPDCFTGPWDGRSTV